MKQKHTYTYLFIEDIDVKCSFNVFHQPKEHATYDYPGCDEVFEVEELDIEPNGYDKKLTKQFRDDEELDSDDIYEYKSDGVVWGIAPDGTLSIIDWDSSEILSNMEHRVNV